MFRPVSQSQDTVHHDVQWITHVGWRTGPPKVHHYVERRRCFDVMPPHARIEQGVPGFEIRNHGCFERFAHPRVSFEIRILQVDHGHHLAAWGGIQRSRVQVVNLLRWKQREAPVADDAAGDIVRNIVVCRGYRFGAYPYFHQRMIVFKLRVVEHEVVMLTQSGKVFVHQQRLDVEIGMLTFRPVFADLREDFSGWGAPGIEIEAGAFRVVRESGVNTGRCNEVPDGLAGRVSFQESHRRFRRLTAGPDEFPVRCEPLHYRGSTGVEELVKRHLVRGYIFQDADWLFPGRHEPGMDTPGFY